MDVRAYASQIKGSVSCRQLLELNGISVNRHGFAVCPLHGDHDASLKVYGGDRGWVCYGCHKGGDVINLAMNLYSVGFQDAMQKLNVEFGLGIDFDKKPSVREAFHAATRIAAEKAKRKKEAENAAYAERVFWKAFDVWLALDRKVSDLAEKMDRLDGFTDEFCETVTKRNEAYEKVIEADERRMRNV